MERKSVYTNESSEYLTKREELRLAEIELMRQRERAIDANIVMVRSLRERSDLDPSA